jgi:hypothetical protein
MFLNQGRKTFEVFLLNVALDKTTGFSSHQSRYLLHHKASNRQLTLKSAEEK